MLRVYTRRVFELANGINDVEQARLYLGALGLASLRLAALLKADAWLSGGQDDTIKQTISSALSEIVNELKLSV